MLECSSIQLVQYLSDGNHVDNMNMINIYESWSRYIFSLWLMMQFMSELIDFSTQNHELLQFHVPLL